MLSTRATPQQNTDEAAACLQLDLVEGSVAVQFVTFAAGRSNERKLTFVKQIARRRFGENPSARAAVEAKLQALPLQFNDNFQCLVLLPQQLPGNAGLPLSLSAP